ncbi:hypothetical protein LBMAG56_42390 [Verrucomicrobiota bacterium]|nr:hypothetical protein LBMAG56_42390 [Verrucomicrobiota bacterium]
MNDFANAKVLHTLPWNSAYITSLALIGNDQARGQREGFRGSAYITSLAFIGNDRVAASSKNGDILIWNLAVPAGKTPDPVRRLVGHTNEINRILVTPDGRTLISVSNDHTVKYWDATSDQGEPGSVVLNDGFLPKGQTEKVDTKTPPPPPIEVKLIVQKPLRDLTNHTEWVMDLAQTPDGKTLVTGDDQGVIIVWDLPAGKERRRWQATQWIASLGISPDGRTVAASQHTPFIRYTNGLEIHLPQFHLWDVESGQSKLDLGKVLGKDFPKDAMSAVVYSPDGKWLAAALRKVNADAKIQGKILLIDPATGNKVRELAGHLLATNDLALHPDGRHLFSCGRDQMIKIWNLDDGKLVREFGKSVERGVWIGAISISPDGRLLAAADRAGQVVIYSLTA